MASTDGSDDEMKDTPLNQLSAQYLAALETHFAQGLRAGLQAAHDLGRVAVALGLETLDLAKIHEQALVVLRLRNDTPVQEQILTSHAADFFAEAIMPIEETHVAALEALHSLTELNTTLTKRTLDLADSDQEKRRQINARKRAEAALRHNETASRELRADLGNGERHLQAVAHRILAATESERKKMSRQLNDEIAQTLMGINIRLLTLKHEATANSANLTEEIETTQHLIEDCVILINRLADEFSNPQEQPAD